MKYTIKMVYVVLRDDSSALEGRYSGDDTILLGVFTTLEKAKIHLASHIGPDELPDGYPQETLEKESDDRAKVVYGLDWGYIDYWIMETPLQ